MIVQEPVTIPETIPVAEPTAAMMMLLAVQVPPGTASLSVVVAPGHTFAVPVITDGEVLTVTFFVVIHPASVV